MPTTDPKTRHAHVRDRFVDRHLGPSPAEIEAMLKTVGVDSLGALIDQAVPASIRMSGELVVGEARTEAEVLDELAGLAGKNQVWRSYIGMGYHDCLVPPVIRRALFENPGWYTSYTPYQAEISQGRLEALLNFQTMVGDLTGLPVTNASMLDESTAAAEAMTLCHRVTHRKLKGDVFLVSDRCHPQTIAVVSTRARPLDIDVRVVDLDGELELPAGTFGALIQYPTTDGQIVDYGSLADGLHACGAMLVAACDLLALTLLRPPGEFGADIAVGNSQRFGVPLGYGGPHAGFLATAVKHQRQVPGRIVGVSKDADGRPGYRLAMQTREQHIRRDKATSNICTAQVLLAVMASMFAVYHGAEGLKRIARRIHRRTATLADAVAAAGSRVHDGPWFDTLRITADDAAAVAERAAAARINLRRFDDGDFGVALDQMTTAGEVGRLAALFGAAAELDGAPEDRIPAFHARRSGFLTHPVFESHHSETQLLRYLHRLENRDLSLNTSMIPLGSCTMKLNAAAEMYPVSFDGFARLHPFVPDDQAEGYAELFRRLSCWLGELTGLPGVSLMPNAGAQGEYAGLLVIDAFHRTRGEVRDVCLIPSSAHGTNPASAVMAGMRVAVVRCDEDGNIEVEDLRAKAAEHGERLAALMVTYPSTHGVFEDSIEEICRIVHDHGGLVYLDGANMNALVGLSRLNDLGADVCHLNLHKSFCIPHGGGGPGMGPICVTEQLTPFLPGHPLAAVGGEQAIGPISAAPWGSPSILTIPYAYIAMMGGEGLRKATEVAILNANYIACRLEGHYDVVYRGSHGRVAHECIIDTRPFRDSAGITVEDVAKRLIDYGFHAPTMSWPVAGTLMIEPTESESKDELDRFCDAMIAIREEIREIEEGRLPRDDNPLVGAPHTAAAIADEGWSRAYTRERAVFPAPWVREHKFWPPVSRIDNAYGDRHLVCSCPPLSASED